MPPPPPLPAVVRISRDITTEVLVVGAGPAGFCAAIAAARAGRRTLLVERYGAAGGAMTLGLNLTPVGFEPFKYWTTQTDPEGWAVQGVARTLADRMVAAGAVCKPVWDGETCKWLIDQLLAEAGVQVLYHAHCAEAWLEGDTLRGAYLATRGGLWRVAAEVCIDCSGDGELFAKAGASFDFGRESDGLPQPMALVATLGGLQLGLPPEGDYSSWLQATRALVAPHLDAAWQSGKIPPTFAGILFPRVVRGGVLTDQAWARLVPRWADPTNPEEVAAAEVEARDVLQQIVAFMRNEVPGCANAAVLQTSAEVWPRESRRVHGIETLHEDDIYANRRRPDGIAHGTGFLEIHSATPNNPRPEAGLEWQRRASLIDAEVDYDIAYGCLVPRTVDNLLVAGRCLSATHLAQSSARMQVTCMAMGEAAGTAAALAIAGACQPRAVAVGLLREALVAAGARV